MYYLFTWVRILTPSLPGCVTLASELISWHLRLLVHIVQRTATLWDARTTCVKVPSAEWVLNSSQQSSAWVPLLPASPYYLNCGFSQGHLFPWGGPDQLWPQAWLASPIPMGQGTGNGGLWGSSPIAPIHLLPAGRRIWDPCVCSPSQRFWFLVYGFLIHTCQKGSRGSTQPCGEWPEDPHRKDSWLPQPFPWR